MLAQFLEEYEKAIDELTSISADPVLKGSYLHEKISELKSTVKRKYGAKVLCLEEYFMFPSTQLFCRFKSFKKNASTSAAEQISLMLPKKCLANGELICI